MEKLKTLQAIIDGAGIEGVKVEDYDHTQPDGMDESQSGGFWDMAGDIAFILCPTGYTDDDGHNLDAEAGQLQSLLYNLMCPFKTTREYEIMRSDCGTYFYICKNDKVLTDDDGNAIHFATLDEAQDYIDEQTEV